MADHPADPQGTLAGRLRSARPADRGRDARCRRDRRAARRRLPRAHRAGAAGHRGSAPRAQRRDGRVVERPAGGRRRSVGSAAIARQSCATSRADSRARPSRRLRTRAATNRRRSSFGGRCRISISRNRCSPTRTCRIRRSTRCRSRPSRTRRCVDLVLTAARTGGTREATVALLRSSLLGASRPARRVGARRGVGARRRAGRSARDRRGRHVSPAVVDDYFDDRGDAPEGSACVGAARGRAPRRRFARSSRRIATRGRRIASAPSRRSCGATSGSPDADDAGARDRHLRARAAILGTLDALAAACDVPRRSRREDPTAWIRHAIEARTFAPRRGARRRAPRRRAGRAVRRRSITCISSAWSRTDWPERPARSIFYTSGLLEPARMDRAPGARGGRAGGVPRPARRSRARTTTLHAFNLDGDADRRAFAGGGARARRCRRAMRPAAGTARLRGRGADERRGRRRTRAGWRRVARAAGALRPDLDANRVSRRTSIRGRAGVSREARRALRDVPVQVLRGIGARAAGGARRIRGTDAARARHAAAPAAGAVLSRVAGDAAGRPSRARSSPTPSRSSSGSPAGAVATARRAIARWKRRGCSGRS